MPEKESAAVRVQRLTLELKSAEQELGMERRGQVYLYRARHKEDGAGKTNSFFWGTRTRLPAHTAKREIMALWLVNVDMLTIESNCMVPDNSQAKDEAVEV